MKEIKIKLPNEVIKNFQGIANKNKCTIEDISQIILTTESEIGSYENFALDKHKYEYRIGKRVVHSGTTDNLGKEQMIHADKYTDGYIVQVDKNKTQKAKLIWV